MRNIVELSDGHVFVKGSVVHVGPMGECYDGFLVTGVGFSVAIGRPDEGYDYVDRASYLAQKARFVALRQEYIDKLLCVPDESK
jgi:hypothetical protein